MNIENHMDSRMTVDDYRRIQEIVDDAKAQIEKRYRDAVADNLVGLAMSVLFAEKRANANCQDAIKAHKRIQELEKQIMELREQIEAASMPPGPWLDYDEAKKACSARLRSESEEDLWEVVYFEPQNNAVKADRYLASEVLKFFCKQSIFRLIPRTPKTPTPEAKP